MARTIYELEFYYSGKDNRGEKHLTFNERRWTLGLGERFKILAWGESTLKYLWKEQSGYYPAYDSTSHLFSLDRA
jgi:hypothetical protein